MDHSNQNPPTIDLQDLDGKPLIVVMLILMLKLAPFVVLYSMVARYLADNL